MPIPSLWRHALQRPEHEAIVTGTERVTMRTLQRRVAALMNHLRERGVQPMDIVPLVLENGADFVVALLAVLGVGARPLPISPAWTTRERETLLEGILAPVALVEPTDPSGSRLASAHDVGPFVREAEPVSFAPDAEVLLPTSGSTGTPKIVRLGLAGLVWNATAHAASIGLGPEDRVFVVSPMVHAATLVAQVIAGVKRGATLVCQRGPFMPRAFLKALEIERITATSLTPTHARMVLERGMSRGIPLGDLSRLAWVSIGAAPAEAALLKAFSDFLAECSPARLYVTYGLTEAGPRVSLLPPDRLVDRAETVGLPLEGLTVKVEEGQLFVRTPSRMLGYLDEPPLTEEWLATGDLASLDAEGFITLHGRIKELIVSGGINISPFEVEKAILQDERIRDAAVVGIPHPVYGEVPVAYVVPAMPLAPDEVLTGLGGRLAPYKLPRQVHVLAELPRTATGKVDKRQLREGHVGE